MKASLSNRENENRFRGSYVIAYELEHIQQLVSIQDSLSSVDSVCKNSLVPIIIKLLCSMQF